jgi:hypothetical protein
VTVWQPLASFFCGEDREQYSCAGDFMSVFGTLTMQGAWASGKLLIAKHDAVLPPYRIRCDVAPRQILLPRKFNWHPQWLYFFILVAIFIYIILALAMRKPISLQIPLCARHLEKYRALRLASVVLLLGCIPEMVVAGNYLPEQYMVWGIAAGLSAMIAGLLCLIIFGSVLRAKRIDRDYGYFFSASPAFLQLLPQPPPGMIIPR